MPPKTPFDILGRNKKKPDARSREEKIQAALGNQSPPPGSGPLPLGEKANPTDLDTQSRKQGYFDHKTKRLFDAAKKDPKLADLLNSPLSSKDDAQSAVDPRIAARRKQVKDDKNFGPEAQAKRTANADQARSNRTAIYKELHGDEALHHATEANRRHKSLPEVGSPNLREPEEASRNDSRYNVWDNGRDDTGNHYMTVTGSGTHHFVRKPSGQVHYIPGEVHAGHTIRHEDGSPDMAGTTERYLMDHHNDKEFKIPEHQAALESSKTFANSSAPRAPAPTGKPKLSVAKTEPNLNGFQQKMKKSTLCKREKAWSDKMKKSWKVAGEVPADKNLEKARVESDLSARGKRVVREDRRIGANADTLSAGQTKVPGVSKQGASARAGNTAGAKDAARSTLSALKMGKSDGLEKAGMFHHSGDRERIPARELSKPNLKESGTRAKTWTAGGPEKQLAGTSIGQGQAVRDGEMADAKDAAQRTLNHMKRQPRPNLGKSDDLKKGKNKKEQRAKVFGNDANGARTSDNRMKMMQTIKAYAKNKHGVDMAIAGGKRDASGEIKGKKPLEQETYDVLSPQGIQAEKDRQSKIKEVNEGRTADGQKPLKRYDPKPDWRSGQLETQPSPDAAVHELAHFVAEKPGQNLGQMQTRMDEEWGDSQSKYGHMQQKKTKGEIQPMAMENKLRRRMGLPATAPTKNEKPMSEHGRPVDQSIDDSGPRFTRGVKPGKNPKSVDYDRSSRLLSLENKEKLDQVDRGEVAFHPEKGWQPTKTVNGKINQRAREKSNDMGRKDFDTLQRSEGSMEPVQSCKYSSGNGTHMKKSESGGCWYCGQLSRKKS